MEKLNIANQVECKKTIKEDIHKIVRTIYVKSFESFGIIRIKIKSN